MALITLAVIGTAAAVGGAMAQRKAAKAARRAQAAEQRRADIANARERRAAIRNARMARASVEAQATNTGLGDSSALAGSVANIQSSLGADVSFLDQNIQLSQQASAANEEAAKWQSRAATAEAIGNLAGKAGGVYGG